jgi:hypothetical protein
MGLLRDPFDFVVNRYLLAAFSRNTDDSYLYYYLVRIRRSDMPKVGQASLLHV